MEEFKVTTETGFYWIHTEKKILYELEVKLAWNSAVWKLCALLCLLIALPYLGQLVPLSLYGFYYCQVFPRNYPLLPNLLSVSSSVLPVHLQKTKLWLRIPNTHINSLKNKTKSSACLYFDCKME